MATTTTAGTGKIETYLGAKAESLLGFKSPKIAKERLHLPGPDFIDRVWSVSDRNVRVLANLHRLFHHGRLSGTGYMSILPVDQGIEHSAGASFAKNPDYFDGGNIVKLAVEGGCNAVASSAPPSTSAPTRPTAKSSKSAAPSRKRTNSGWRPFCGATCATAPSKRTRTTTSPRT